MVEKNKNLPGWSFKLSPLGLGVRLAIGLCAPHVALASDTPGVPLGGEFQVNADPAGFQHSPVMAMDADGDFVIAWQDGSDIFARRFSADGAARDASDVLVNSVTGVFNSEPSVAMNAGGDYVVAWETFEGEIVARRFSADGTPLDPADVSISPSSQGQSDASVAMDADGDFVVAWYGGGYDIFARRFNADGTAKDAAEIPVITQPVGFPSSPSVAVDADGDFAVAWDGGPDIYARRFNADGTPRDPSEVQVNTGASGGQADQTTSIAMDADGDLVIVWEDGTDNVVARRFSADGTPLDAADVQVNTTPSAFDPSVAMDADGDFVVAWGEYYFCNNVRARRFSAGGAPRDASDLPVNTNPLHWADGTCTAAVAADADGDFVVAWDDTYNHADGDGTGVLAQRFAGFEDVDLSIVVNDSQDPVEPGGTFNYTFIVTNNHAIGTTTGVAAIDGAIGVSRNIQTVHTLPQGLSLAGFSGSDWSCTQASRTEDRVDCSYSGILLPTAMTVADLTLNFNVMAPAAADIQTGAIVSADQYDSNAANNTDTENTAVQAPDTLPDEDGEEPLGDFVAQTNVSTNTLVNSNPITVTGIDAPTPVSITGVQSAAYSINGGAFTSAAGSVSAGDSVRVQQTSWPEFSTTTNATLVIGGVARTFSVTTAPAPTGSATSSGRANDQGDTTTANADNAAATDDGGGSGGGCTLNGRPAAAGFGWETLAMLCMVLFRRRKT